MFSGENKGVQCRGAQHETPCTGFASRLTRAGTPAESLTASGEAKTYLSLRMKWGCYTGMDGGTGPGTEGDLTRFVSKTELALSCFSLNPTGSASCCLSGFVISMHRSEAEKSEWVLHLGESLGLLRACPRLGSGCPAPCALITDDFCISFPLCASVPPSAECSSHGLPSPPLGVL